MIQAAILLHIAGKEGLKLYNTVHWDNDGDKLVHYVLSLGSLTLAPCNEIDLNNPPWWVPYIKNHKVITTSDSGVCVHGVVHVI